MDVRHDNNALQELNDCIRGLLHLGLNVITFRTLLHLGPNVITFKTLLHLGQLLHLGLQQTVLATVFSFLLLEYDVSQLSKSLLKVDRHTYQTSFQEFFKAD